MYLLLSHPPGILRIMRKTPLYQGKEQPLRKCVAGAATDISRGSKGHVQQGAGGGSSSTDPRTGRTLAPKHAQQGAGGGSSRGAYPADAAGSQGAGVSLGRRSNPAAPVPVDAGGGGSAVDVDRCSNPAAPVLVDAVEGFGEVRGSNSGGLTSGVRPVDVAGGGGRGGSAGLGIRSGLDSRYCHNSASLMVCSGGSCTPGAASSTGSVSTDSR